MIFKMALMNVKKSYKDYLIYFLTLTFAIALFYIVNSVSANILDEIIKSVTIRNITNSIITTITYGITFGLLFLIVYANRFIMKRRYKELGLYILFGMSKKQVASIITVETIFVGIFSLIAGTILGALLSQFFIYVSMNLFNLPVGSFHLYVSGYIWLKTAIIFGIMFIITIALNSMIIAKVKLINLFQYGKKEEKIFKNNLIITMILFILSICVYAYLYLRLLNKDLDVGEFVNAELFPITIIGMVNTFVFFYAISGFILQFIKTSKRLFYYKLNTFTFRQLSSRVRSHFLSISFISILLFFGIAAITISMSFISEVTRIGTESYTHDVIAEVVEVNDSLLQNLTKNYNLKLETQYTEKKISTERGEITVIRASDYNKENKNNLALDDSTIAYAGPHYVSALEILNSNTSNSFTKEMNTAAIISPFSTRIVVSDNSFNKIVGENVQNFEVLGFKDVDNYFADKNYTDDNFQKEVAQLRNQLDGKHEYSARIDIHAVTINTNNLNNFILVILGTYLSLVLILSGITILALQQVSQAIDNRDQYNILFKLGVGTNMIKRSIFWQLVGYFVIPLIFAFVNTFVGMSFIVRTAKVSAGLNLYGPVGWIFTGITIAYLVYGIITYIMYYNTIKDVI